MASATDPTSAPGVSGEVMNRAHRERATGSVVTNRAHRHRATDSEAAGRSAGGDLLEVPLAAPVQAQRARLVAGAVDDSVSVRPRDA